MQYQEDLAYIHHSGFSGLAEGAAPWIVSTLRRAGFSDGRVVELGCGGGVLLEALAGAGYEPYGVDLSAEMLAIAKTVAPRASLEQASLFDCAIPPCVAVIAMGEGLNYWPEAGAPPTAEVFRRVADALEPQGLFLFDVLVRDEDTPRPYRSWVAGDDWACLVAVESEGAHLVRGITTFRSVGSMYRRGHEAHRVHLYGQTTLEQELRQAGLEPATRRAYGPTPLAPGRRLFLCRRVTSEG